MTVRRGARHRFVAAECGDALLALPQQGSQQQPASHTRSLEESSGEISGLEPDCGRGLPEDGPALAGELISRFGGHSASELGLDLEAAGESDLRQWLVAACLLTASSREQPALTAFRALRKAGLDEPRELAASDLPDVAAQLDGAGLPKAEAVAKRLLRVSRTLERDYAGSLWALANRSTDLEELASRLARLAPGFGRAAVRRFLQPLRDLWPSAADLPLDPAARAAAVHLGLIAPGQDQEGGPGALRAALREGTTSLLRDVEAALARLGRRSCLREQTSRCPLGAQCPAAARGRWRTEDPG